jgi:hypothetical protein
MCKWTLREGHGAQWIRPIGSQVACRPCTYQGQVPAQPIRCRQTLRSHQSPTLGAHTHAHPYP